MKEAAERILKVKPKPGPDWFSASRERLKPLVDKERMLYGKLETIRRNGGGTSNEAATKEMEEAITKEELRATRADTRKEVKTAKQSWQNKKAKEAANHRDPNHYEAIKQLIEGTSNHHKKVANALFKNAEGKEPDSMKESANNVQEHFEKVFNRKVDIDPSALDEIPDHTIMWELADQPTLQEVETAIKEMKSSAATGDGLSPAVLKALSQEATGTIHEMTKHVWNNTVNGIPDAISDTLFFNPDVCVLLRPKL